LITAFVFGERDLAKYLCKNKSGDQSPHSKFETDPLETETDSS